MDQTSGKSGMRFLSFSDDKEDAEKEAKLKEAALKIEQSMARQKALSELVDYNPTEEQTFIDPANDTRSLYERLMEQKNKKKEAVEESQKLSNLVTKLDEEDASYLNEVARQRQEMELKKRLEVYDVMEEKKRMIEQRSLDEEKRLKESLIGKSRITNSNSTLKSKLSSMIKVRPKMRPDIETTEIIESPDQPCDGSGKQTKASTKRPSGSSETTDDAKTILPLLGKDQDDNRDKRAKRRKDDDDDDEKDGKSPGDNLISPQSNCTCPQTSSTMKCIGILPSLPIVEKHNDSSDESNSDDDLERRLVPQIRKK